MDVVLGRIIDLPKIFRRQRKASSYLEKRPMRKRRKGLKKILRTSQVILKY